MTQPDRGGTMLQVEVGRVKLANPVLTASGTLGFGQEFASFVELSRLGGIVTKTLYRHRRRGNPPPRIVEAAGGMLNSIGLENPGCDAFEERMLPWLLERGITVVVSCAGETPDDFSRVAERVDRMKGVAAVEVNLSCPNVEKGGLDLGTDPDVVHRIVASVRDATGHPLWIKLTPNVTDVAALARAAVAGGAEALSLINTLSAMALDWRRRRSRLGTQTGGLSGPAIKPVALRVVWQVARAVDVPIVGIGGIRTAEDVLEFLVAGATAVQVGTANFFRPTVSGDLLRDLERELETAGIGSVGELVGTLEDSSGPCGSALPPVDGRSSEGTSAERERPSRARIE